MKKMCSWLWLLLLLIPGFAVGGQPSYQGFNDDVDPGIQVIDSLNGPALVKANFKLFSDQAPSDALYPSDFTVEVDGNPELATIVRPPQPKAMADIVFCLDVSGSMGGEIQAVKNNTQGFVNKLTSQNFDVRLGLITFGQSSKPYLRKQNSGQFYFSPQDFINEVDGLSATGSHEEWFDCLVHASQYPYRFGAERITILVTDENGDSGQYDITTAMPVVVNNASKVYGVAEPGLGNVVTAVDTTNGTLFNIIDPFETILDSIANSILNTYSVSLSTNAGPGQHDLCVIPISNDPVGKDCESFMIGANPVVTLSQPTQDLVTLGVAPGTSGLNIQANVTDDGSVQAVNITWNDPTSPPSTVAMSSVGAGIYDYTYSGTLNSASECFAFSIQAIDNEGRNTTVPANQGNSPNGQWRICAEDSAPVITTITPSSYDYQQPVAISAEISDDPAGAASLAVHLKYRETGEVLWDNVAMSMSTSNGNSGTFIATVPDAIAGFKGIDLEVVAQDVSNNVATESLQLTVNNIQVTIVDVTRHTDTIDTGPFSVHAVVAGLDLANGGSVELNYDINGAASTLPMTQAVTGTSATMPTNSNIYVEKIPAVNAGDKVCYLVTASNPTANIQSQSNCFEVLQPAAPLALTPASVIIAIGDSPVEFMATGGYGNYEWNALNGGLSTTLGDKTTYEPLLAGLDKISATDLKGFTATSVINVLPALDINPAVDGKRFSPSSIVQLTAIGAEAPYKWQVKNATFQASGNDNEIIAITLGIDPATIEVTVTDNAGRDKVVSFTNNGQLTIDPAGPEITVAPDSETPFIVSGGDGSYTWITVGGDVDDPSLANVTYKAPSLPGVYHVTVSDSAGDSASVIIKSGDPLRVTPQCARVQRGETPSFSVVSGTSPFLWETDFGSLSATSGDQNTYTPEAELGVYEVRVFDNAGGVANLCVMVAEPLVVTPAQANVARGGTLAIEVSGGSGFYKWSSIHGTVSPNSGGTTTYTAPMETGKDTITVRDSAGLTAKVEVNVTGGDDVFITPSTSSLEIGGTLQLVASGGDSNYTWTANLGTVSSSGFYTAPANVGTATVTVEDSAGHSATATIEVIVGKAPTITPSEAKVGLNGVVTLTVTGGKASYTWSSTIGTISPSGDNVTFAAPGSIGIANVSVIDAFGNSGTATIEVKDGGDLTVTPTIDTVDVEGTTSFTGVGGTPPYTWSATAGSVSPNSGSSQTIFTAPSNPGESTITLSDNAGATVTATVKIGIAVLTVTPANASLQVNETVELNVAGGKAPYTWSATSGSVAPLTGAKTTFTVPSDAFEPITVTVRDDNGTTATATISCAGNCGIGVLNITPANASLKVDETIELNVVGGKAPYTWSTASGSVSPLSGDKTTFAAPGGAFAPVTVTVRDDTGATATATMSCTSPCIADLGVTPAITAVDIGDKREFVATGGDGVYTWTADLGTIDSSTGLYTAPDPITDPVTDAKVTVTDGSGKVATAKVKVMMVGDLGITPRNVNLLAAGTQAFTVHNARGEVSWSADTGDIDAAGNYTAPTSSGVYTVTATDYISGRSIDATVTVGAKLSLTPSEGRVSTNGSTNFTVNGGEAPYIWRVVGAGSLDSTEGERVEYTAGSSAGTATLIVADNQGITEEATITIDGILYLTPEEATLAPGGKQTFTVSGGSPSYTLVATQGNVDNDGNYTAPMALGVYTVTANDTAGNSVAATVTVDNVPVISPAMGWLDQNGNMQFNVVGGTPPYAWVTTAGSVTTSGEKVTYTAPRVSSEVTVTVTDNLNQESTAVVYVDIPLKATKKDIYLEPGQTAKVAVTGGIPPFDWQTGTGETKDVRTEEAGSNFYTAPRVTGEDFIEIRDSKNDTTTVNVHVVPIFAVTPYIRYMKFEETKTFTALLGTPPYFATKIMGDGEIDPDQSDDGKFTFTAGSVANDDVVIEFSDSGTQKITVHAYIEQKLRANPATLYVDKNGTAKFRVSGGTGGFGIDFEAGFADVDEKGVGTYTAPNRYGEYQLTAFDSSDQELSIKAVVERSVPKISPSVVTMAPDETKTLMVSRGAPPYEWAFEGSLVQRKDSSNSVIQITAPDTGGTYKATVEDAAGNLAEANINVIQPLMISPAHYQVYKGESAAVRFNQLGGAGNCDWTLTDVQEIAKGDNFVVVRPRADVELGSKYSVGCRDQNGEVAKATITVGSLPADLDGNGVIDDEEVQICVDKFFDKEPLAGEKIDKRQLFLHVESNINININQ